VNQRVDVVGRLSVRETEYEGKTRVELHVSATSVSAAVKRGQSAPAVDVSAPF
jgi:hypothetical protein